MSQASTAHGSKRTTYSGSRRRLVLAFDIGTTFSGVSYSILDPGLAPEIRGVTRFPAHEQVNGASKIPTVLWYRKDGTMAAAGAEASREGIFDTASEEGWEKAHWFKMHIRSRRGTTLDLAEKLPPLPFQKTVIEILADFMAYLFRCARDYIQSTHANGRELWASVERSVDFVISHPNGWEGYQQAQMCDAAVLAGLVPDSEKGRGRITFLTEGEASLHYAIRNGLADGALKDGDGVVIVDAGGGTVDVSAYRKRVRDGRFEEIAVPQCHFVGSVFVSVQARLALERLLRDTSYSEDIDHIVDRFDQTTKLRFRNDLEPQFIRFGGNRDNDPALGIRYGQLKLSGKDVAGFFEPSVSCIVSAVLEQVQKAHNPISHVILVGGFASSDWLYDQLCKRLGGTSLSVVRPENYTAKAVSDGAISFFLRRQVRTRVSKYAYGAFYSVTFNPENPEHIPHRSSVYLAATGRQRLGGSFKVIIPKNAKIEEKREYRSASTYRFRRLETLRNVQADVWCYRGENPNPQWKDDEPGMYSKLCQIVMDMSNVPYKTHSTVNGRGVYHEIDYDYILFYRGVELRAQLAWREGGVEKRSPATVVYDPTD